MAERDRPVYCARCGSIVHPEDNFCGVCGARVPPNDPDVTPPQGTPTQAHAPPRVSAGDRKLGLVLLIGAGVVLVLALGIGSVAALILLGSESNSLKPTDRKEAAAGASDTTAPGQNNDKTTAPKPAGAASEAQKKPRQPSSEEASGPSPGYNLIQTPDESLKAQVPPSWGVETGEDSEGEGTGPNSWSTTRGSTFPPR